ncbi:unnamed protein product [Darwinula stevensoni]|uniref:S-phase kinase-associated protein 1 n=1 Tax=Darwinula stevensoni TaxID=69355 RepID=A0A7R9A753_9CRUS|nr:unnamed protein product [Darwinula stevensoni]CAG0890322.1 unnamed protein product [Darwinula stevensoni]
MPRVDEGRWARSGGPARRVTRRGAAKGAIRNFVIKVMEDGLASEERTRNWVEQALFYLLQNRAKSTEPGEPGTSSSTAAAAADSGFGPEKATSRVTSKMPNIILESSDGEVFEVDVEIAKLIGIIQPSLENLDFINTFFSLENYEEEDSPWPLPNVNGAILKKVIQWCTYHKGDPPADEDNKEKCTDDISSWDADFLKVDQGTLFELILAANYLDIKDLLDVTCKTVANMLKGKTSKEIYKTFNIRNDFTPAEEEELRKQNE